MPDTSPSHYEEVSTWLNEQLSREEQRFAQYERDLVRYQETIRKTVIRRIVASILVTVACYAFLFDRVNTESVWWLMIVAIGGHAVLTAAASVMFLTRFSILFAFLMGFLTSDAVGYMFPREHCLIPALLPMTLAMIVVPLIFRRPKRPDMPIHW